MSLSGHSIAYGVLLLAAAGAAYGLYRHGEHVCRGDQAIEDRAALQQAITDMRGEQDRANRLSAGLEAHQAGLESARADLQAKARAYAARRAQAPVAQPQGHPQAFGLDAEGLAIWNAGAPP